MSYSVRFVNNSTQTGTVCLFQYNPAAGGAVRTLAWMARTAAPTAEIDFSWVVSYSFVWARTGALTPGVVFTSQNWPADLSTKNQVTFTRIDDVYYAFTDQKAAMQQGTLVIENGTVPANTFAVGIGLSGLPVVAMQAVQGMTYAITPGLPFCIAFGDYVQGQVLDPSLMSNIARITFPSNVDTVTATLNADESWTIGPT